MHILCSQDVLKFILCSVLLSHLYSAQRFRCNARTVWWSVNFVLLGCAGWTQGVQTERDQEGDVSLSLSFVECQSESAQCPLLKATTRKSSAAVCSKYCASFAEYCSCGRLWLCLLFLWRLIYCDFNAGLVSLQNKTFISIFFYHLWACEHGYRNGLLSFTNSSQWQSLKSTTPACLQRRSAMLPPLWQHELCGEAEYIDGKITFKQ